MSILLLTKRQKKGHLGVVEFLLKREDIDIERESEDYGFLWQ